MVLRVIDFELYRPQNRPYYMPGDIVSGLCHININAALAQDIQRVDVLFTGRSEIDLREKHSGRISPHNSTYVFFELRTNLISWQHPEYPAPDTYLWPFEFTFPWMGSNALLHGAGLSEGDRLPPSMSLDCTTRVNNSYGMAEPWEGKVRVIYELEAQIFGLQGFITQRGSTAISFNPFAWYPEPKLGLTPMTKPLVVESPFLKPFAERSSFSRAMKRFAAKLPVSKIKLTLEVPAHATMGEDLALFLGVDYDTDNSTATELPEVSLISLVASYEEQVRIGPEPRFAAQSQVPVSGRFPRKMLRAVILGGSMVVTERADVRQHVVPGCLAPKESNFQTINIRKFHDRFTVTVVVSIAKKSFEVRFMNALSDSRPLLIHPIQPPRSAEELSSEPVRPPELESAAVVELPHLIPEIDSNRIYYELP